MKYTIESLKTRESKTIIPVSGETTLRMNEIVKVGEKEFIVTKIEK